MITQVGITECDHWLPQQGYKKNVWAFGDDKGDRIDKVTVSPGFHSNCNKRIMVIIFHYIIFCSACILHPIKRIDHSTYVIRNARLNDQPQQTLLQKKRKKSKEKR